MEVPKSERKWLLVAAYELLGTALFVYCILTSMGNPLAAVVGLFSSIIVFGGITGGHFNPAVSIGVFLANGKYATQLLLLILKLLLVQVLELLLTLIMVNLKLIHLLLVFVLLLCLLHLELFILLV